MSNSYRIRIDLPKLSARLGSAADYAAAAKWLREEGFVDGGDQWWYVPADSILAVLVPDEILYAEKAAFPARFRSLELPHLESDDDDDEPSYVASRIRHSRDPGELHLPVPASLVGRHRDVVRAFRPIVRAAVKQRSWEAALANVEWVSVNDVPGQLVLHGPSIFVGDDCLLLYPVFELIEKACKAPDRNEWYRRERDAVLSGADSFWFCLVLLAHGGWFHHCELRHQESKVVAAALLTKLLPWWDEFALLDGADRFGFGIPTFLTRGNVWLGAFLSLFNDLGMPKAELDEIKELDLGQAGEQMRDWLASYRMS